MEEEGEFRCWNDTENMTTYHQLYHCSKIMINLTTCQPIQSPEEMETIRNICLAANYIWNGGLWIAIITGLVGNTLAIFVISSFKPASTATFCVGLLAVSDIVAIIVRTVIYFQYQKDLDRLAPYFFLFPMLFDFCASYSNWLLVLICVERFITVRYPLHKRYFFTVRHARIFAVVIFVVLFSIYNACTWTLGYEDPPMFHVRNLLYAVLPLGFIIIIVILIACQMNRVHKGRKQMNGCVHFQARGTGSASEDCRLYVERKSVLGDLARLENSITVMMIVAAVCFTVLTIPSCMMNYLYHDMAKRAHTPVQRAQWFFLYQIFNLLTFFNFSINFILYSLSSKKFRDQFCKVVCFLKTTRRDSSMPAQLPYPSTSETYL